MTADLTQLPQARQEFLAYLKFTKGHRDTTCYNYGSDLNIWGRWLAEVGLDWRRVASVDLERYVAALSRNGAGPHAVARKVSSLATFYRWAKRQEGRGVRVPAQAGRQGRHPQADHATQAAPPGSWRPTPSSSTSRRYWAMKASPPRRFTRMRGRSA